MKSTADILRSKVLNGWGLFLLLCSVMTAFNVLHMQEQDITVPEGVSEMIGYSVRWAVPFIYVVVAISSLKMLFPGSVSSWLMRNRKYIGLVFAYAMAWQAVFIFILSTFYRDYYFSEVYYFRDEVEGSVGYIFLAAMVMTSFNFARKRINSAQWSLIQKGGIYFLWAYPFSVYWWNLFYYPYQAGYSSPELHDYVFYVLGFAAFVVRIFAWGKLRLQRLSKHGDSFELLSAQGASGVVLVAVGFFVSVSGHQWFSPVSAALSSPTWSAEAALWLPFWPLEPFFSLMIIAMGVMLITSGKGMSNLAGQKN